jgi:hypothetical protein
VLDRPGRILLSKQHHAEREVRALVLRVRGDELLEQAALLGPFGVRACVGRRDLQLLAVGQAISRRDGLRECARNSVPVGDAFARASSASPKDGSSAIALSKCAIESVTRRRSARLRPSRNS